MFIYRTKKNRRYIKTKFVKFYEKDNEVNEIYFPVRLDFFKRANVPKKIQITPFLMEIKT